MSAAGLADVAGDQVQVVDGDHAVGAVCALVDAHGPDGHGRTGVAVDAGDVANGVLVNAADPCGRDRVVLFDQFCEALIALGVGLDIGAVFQALFKNDVGQCIQ